MLKIVDPICFILNDETFDSFTIVEFRDKYLDILNDSTSKITARNVVYRQTLKLVNKGLLRKKSSTNNRQAKYFKTASFKEFNIVPKTQKKNMTSHENKDNKFKYLNSRLKELQVDLFSCAGETEEYLLQLKTLPEFAEHLRYLYRNSQENSSKILGRIKAIQNVLNLQVNNTNGS